MSILRGFLELIHSQNAKRLCATVYLTIFFYTNVIEDTTKKKIDAHWCRYFAQWCEVLRIALAHSGGRWTLCMLPTVCKHLLTLDNNILKLQNCFFFLF